MPGPLAQFVVTTQPPSTATSLVALPAFSITAEDAAGNVISNYVTPLKVVLGTAPTGAAIGGTTTVTPVNGVATFTGLTLNKAGAYTLTTQAISGVTAGTTNTITVSAAGLASLIVTSQPTSVTANTTAFPSTFTVVVQGADASGNPVPSLLSTSTVTLSITSGSSRETLGGTLTATPSGGVATFTGLDAEPRRRRRYTIKATSASPDRGDDQHHHRHARAGREAGDDHARERRRRHGSAGRRASPSRPRIPTGTLTRATPAS